MNVLVINHCSTNKGDKAVLEFVLRELVNNRINNITVSTNEPRCCNTNTLYNGVRINYVPWGWNVERNRKHGLFARIVHRLRREFYHRSYNKVRSLLIENKRPFYLPYYCNREFWKALQAADIVLSTGGHHVTSILAPEAVSPQIFEMALALLAGKDLFLWSQSIGPLDFGNPINKNFIKIILSCAKGIFVRDIHSLAEIEKLGLKLKNVYQTYESAFGLGEVLKPISKPSERAPIVGIAVYSAKRRVSEENEKYITCLSNLVDYAITRGFTVRFFPMQIKGESADDRPCIYSIIEAVRYRNKCSLFEDTPNIIEQINEVAKCQVFIGHKTHSIIFALITGTPLVAIAYHNKTRDFMKQFELSENCIFDSKLDSKNLIQMFNYVIDDLDAIYTKQLSKSQLFGRNVKEDIKQMLKNIK